MTLRIVAEVSKQRKFMSNHDIKGGLSLMSQ